METLLLPLLTLVAGVVSFSSPCCLPLLPGYLSYVSALPVSELGDRDARRVTVGASLLFVGGFTTVFTIFGIGATLVGSLFLRNQDTVVAVSGVVIIAMGLSTMGGLRVPALMRERRVDLNRVPRGPAFAFPMGMAFAAGWAPCIGPVLATILATATAAATGTVAWGAVLLILYSVGLGIPFVLLALGFSRAPALIGLVAPQRPAHRGGRWGVAGDGGDSLRLRTLGDDVPPPPALVRPAGLAADMTVPRAADLPRAKASSTDR